MPILSKKIAHEMFHQSFTIFFSFLKIKNELVDFLEWPYYILEKLALQYLRYSLLITVTNLSYMRKTYKNN